MVEQVDFLRKMHRANRAALSVEVQSANSAALRSLVEARREYQLATHVAAYIAIRGEIDLAPLIKSGFSGGKQFYLPVLRGSAMYFAPWSPDKPLEKKGFGLLEPDADPANYISPSQLDLVLTPLVVFDDKCNRIGQGGGFYDRTFAHKIGGPGSGDVARPVLLGVAHDSQREPLLQPESWDVPLDLIVTERCVYRCSL